MWYCDLPKKQSSALFHFYSWMQTRRQSSVLGGGGHRKFWWGKKNIFEDKDQKQKSLSQMHLCDVGPVAFFLGMIFALGAQKSPLTRILPTHLGEKQKKRTKSSLKMHPSGIGPVAFFWGTIFAWGHILAWGHKNLLWYGFCAHILGED